MEQMVIDSIREIKETLIRMDKDIKNMHGFLMKHMDDEAKNIGEIRVDIAKMQGALETQKELMAVNEAKTALKEKRSWTIISRILSTAAIAAITAIGTLIFGTGIL